MYLHQENYSEPIETVNSTIVGVYKTEAEAERSARKYFFRTLGLKDSGESVNGGYLSSPDDATPGDWDEDVWVNHLSYDWNVRIVIARRIWRVIFFNDE